LWDPLTRWEVTASGKENLVHVAEKEVVDHEVRIGTGGEDQQRQKKGGGDLLVALQLAVHEADQEVESEIMKRRVGDVDLEAEVMKKVGKEGQDPRAEIEKGAAEETEIGIKETEIETRIETEKETGIVIETEIETGIVIETEIEKGKGTEIETGIEIGEGAHEVDLKVEEGLLQDQEAEAEKKNIRSLKVEGTNEEGMKMSLTKRENLRRQRRMTKRQKI